MRTHRPSLSRRVSLPQVLGFGEGQQKDMMRTIAAVLALGNVAFQPGDGEKHAVKDAKVLSTVASLLMVEPRALEGALIARENGSFAASPKAPLLSIPT